jgi:hypothetical protein
MQAKLKWLGTKDQIWWPVSQTLWTNNSLGMILRMTAKTSYSKFLCRSTFQASACQFITVHWVHKLYGQSQSLSGSWLLVLWRKKWIEGKHKELGWINIKFTLLHYILKYWSYNIYWLSPAFQTTYLATELKSKSRKSNLH